MWNIIIEETSFKFRIISVIFIPLFEKKNPQLQLYSTILSTSCDVGKNPPI
jgi:hypothetical protein